MQEPIVITQPMVIKYAELRKLTLNPSVEEGIRAHLTAWAHGMGTPDARLTDSPETRDLFYPIRQAYFLSRGFDPNDPRSTYSKVSFYDPDNQVETTDGKPPVSKSQEDLAAEAEAEEEARRDAQNAKDEAASEETGE